MTSEDTPLTETEAQLMAYLDGELAPEARRAFEARLLDDRELAAELAELRRLVDLTSAMALAEPTDHELRRFWTSFYNRTEWRLGWLLLILGLGVIAGYGVYLLLIDEALPLLFKVAVLATLAGAGILFWNTLRLAIRTSRFDRYRGVMR